MAQQEQTGHQRGFNTDGALEMEIKVDVEVPLRLYDEAQQAVGNDGSVRDHLLDRIEISPRFLISGSPIGED